jgi:hypothetical protein
MPRSDSADRTLGDKLLPRISDVVIKSVIAAKTGLFDSEHRLRVGAGQALIDKMGHEIAELYGPIVDLMLERDDGTIHPAVRKVLEQARTGDDQMKAMGGLLMGPVSGAIGTFITNELAPLVYQLVGSNPNLELDPQTAANTAATGVVSYGNAASAAHDQGFGAEEFQAMVDLAQSIPDPSMLYQMKLRGYFDKSTAEYWLRRAGYPEQLTGWIADLAAAVLSPADAALAVLRGDISKGDGEAIAAQNGYDTSQFNVLLNNTGEPPGAQELMEAFRRGFIDKQRFTTGILQSRVRDEWVQTLLDLRYSPMNTADAVNAYVEGYVSEDKVKSVADQNGLEPGDYLTLIQAAGDPLSFTDMMNLWRYGRATEDDVRAALKRGRLKDDYIDFALALKTRPMSTADAVESEIQGYLTNQQARDIAAQNGLDPDAYDILRQTAGSPASRTEMVNLWRRGKVTKDQVEAALRQSRMKDEYIPQILELKTELPALYMVNDLLGTGGLSPAEGTTILLELGYAEDIVKRIVAYATGKKTLKVKNLTEAMLGDLYMEGAITASEFDADSEKLGYTKAEMDLIRQYYDDKYVITARNSSISKVRTGFLAHKIDEQTAKDELNRLGCPAEQVERLIDDWTIVRESVVTLLTAAQVVDAWQMDLFSDNDTDNTQAALDYLVKNHGYSGDDAITLLEIKNKGPLGSDNEASKVSARKASGQTGQSGG